MLLALLRQLVYVAGVAQGDISMGDPTALFPNYMWDALHPEFPDVQYFDTIGGQGRVRTEFSSTPFYWSTADAAGKRADYVPLPFVTADYLINFAVLKGHSSGITVCGKNHYGSLLRTPRGTLRGESFPDYYDMHLSLPNSRWSPGTGHYRAMVDLMGHRELGGKTLLSLVDGLFGGPIPYPWKSAPFGDGTTGDWPSSLFASQDPVAIDSVAHDFLLAEWPDVVSGGVGAPGSLQGGAEDYLHEAALADAPPSGTVYDPEQDGVGLESLGVHEHWNNAQEKLYSRNLGLDAGIELVSLNTGNFNLTVNSGTGSGSYPSGTTVNLVAAAAPVGQEFDQWTGNTGNVANVAAASTSLTMPAANITVTATYRTVSGGPLSFQPTDDAYLQGTTRFNDNYLKVEAGSRVSYLKFTVSGLSGPVQSAILRLQENGDVGNGTLRVHRGSHNNWTETTLSTANAPVGMGQVGTFTGAVGSGQIVSIDITPLITGNGAYSVVLNKDAGGSDIWFGSGESTRKPQLVIETTGTITLNLGLDDSTGIEHHVLPPSLPRIRFSRLSQTEFVLHWDGSGAAGFQVQTRTSWTEGEWTTLPWSVGSADRLSIPIVIQASNAFFRLRWVGRRMESSSSSDGQPPPVPVFTELKLP
jgi:hypothetical protein